jgi:predicted transcriptional regulator
MTDKSFHKESTDKRLHPKHVRQDGRYKFMSTPEHYETAMKAAEMRSLGMTYSAIGDALGLTKTGAYQAVKRALKEIPVEGVHDLRTIEQAKLDRLERQYNQVLSRKHYKVGNNGKVVTGPEGEPLLDDGPRMQALDGLLKVQQRRAKLMGLDAPTVSEFLIYDIERDTQSMLEAQEMALRALGLGDRVEEFQRVFVAALGVGSVDVIDARSSESPLGLPDAGGVGEAHGPDDGPNTGP